MKFKNKYSSAEVIKIFLRTITHSELGVMYNKGVFIPCPCVKLLSVICLIRIISFVMLTLEQRSVEISCTRRCKYCAYCHYGLFQFLLLYQKRRGFSLGISLWLYCLYLFQYFSVSVTYKFRLYFLLRNCSDFR